MEDTFRSIFQQNFVRLMNERGCLNAEVAKFLNVSPTTIANWRKGKKVPRIDKIDLLCKFFGVNRSDFITLHEEETADVQLIVQNPSAPSARPYYLDEETARLAQDARDNPDLRILFDASRRLSPKDLKTVTSLVKSLAGDSDD